MGVEMQETRGKCLWMVENGCFRNLPASSTGVGQESPGPGRVGLQPQLSLCQTFGSPCGSLWLEFQNWAQLVL